MKSLSCRARENRSIESTARSSWLAVAVSFAALSAVALGWPSVRRGYTDFLAFYAGARLAGTPYLYSTDHFNEIQREYSEPEEVRAYIRPPVYAALLWPLGKLPYRQAHWIWQFLNIAALAGFIFLWSPRPLAVLLCSWYFPLWINFILGQDMPLFLLFISFSAFLMKRGRHFAAGLVFALCGIKFHLFLLVPLLIVAKRLWSFVAGLATGGAIMLAVSFAVGGWDWPSRYYDLLKLNERLQASQSQMANLKGLLFGVSYSAAWLIISATAVTILAWYVIRRAPLDHALAFAIAAGLLVSLHAFVPDCALLLPLLLTLANRIGPGTALGVSMGVGVSTLTLAFPAIAFVGQIALLLFFALLTWWMYRRSGASAP